MASITYWNRVEPRPSTDTIGQPLQGQIRDPLWMLTRQWQFGEFLGVDSGSPAWVQLTERLGNMTGWAPSGGATSPLSAAPIELQLQREAFSPDLATRVELGQLLARLLKELGGDDAAFRAAYPIALNADDPSDPVEAQLRRASAGRTSDGVAAYLKIKANDASVPPAPAAVLTEFVNWIESTFGPLGETPDAVTWVPERLEYSATVAASTATLSVTPGDDGLIDWAAFDMTAAVSGEAIPARVRTIVPAHVRFKGMPNARFWDFEDATLDFGDLKPDQRDLARLALMNFMLVHANDWFMLPVDMPIGGLYQLDSLIVHDVFGVDTLIQRADKESLGPGWTMFSTTATGKPHQVSDFFLLPPSAGSSWQSGRVIEEVRFARDEMANMAWAIENILENAAGAGRPQRERAAALSASTASPASSLSTAPLAYTIESQIPEYWIPLLPVSLDPAAGTVKLELSEALASDGHTLIAPRGRVLQPTSIPAGSPYQIPEEEVPRNGVTVQRFAARSRWTDGSTVMWQLRRVQPGTGESSSALRFDQAAPRTD